MHYKDGTPAKLGDIVQRDDGAVGILIGGQIGQEYCSSSIIAFKPAKSAFGFATGPGYLGVLLDERGAVLERSGVVVEHSTCTQTRECLKIGHVDIGHG
jgi:hypothetical protein